MYIDDDIAIHLYIIVVEVATFFFGLDYCENYSLYMYVIITS